MQRRATLQIVLLRRLLVRHLLATVDQPLLHGRDALFLLDALLNVLDLVFGFDIELDFFTGEGADSALVKEG